MYKYIFFTSVLSLFSFALNAQIVHAGNCMEGEGKYEYASGAVYEGAWSSGGRSGNGKMTYPKGVDETTLGNGPVVLDVYHQQTKSQVMRYIASFNEEASVLFGETFDADNFYTNLADKVGTAYGHDVELTRGYLNLGVKQLQQSTLYSDEQKLIWINKARKQYLNQMLNPNSEQATQAVRAYTQALLKKGEAEKYQAEADHIMLVAYQKLTNDVLSALPFADKAITIITIATGEDLSGAQVSECKRCMDYISLIAPKSLSQMLENTQLASGMRSLAEKMSKMTSEQAQLLISKTGMSPETLELAYTNIVSIYNDYPKSLEWMGNALKSIPENKVKGAIIK